MSEFAAIDEKVKAAFKEAIMNCSPMSPVDVRKFGMDIRQAEAVVRELQNKKVNGLSKTDAVYLSDGETYLEATGGSHIAHNQKEYLGE